MAKAHIPFSFALIALALLSAPSPAGESWVGRCDSVTDGDTISVMRDGKPVKVHLYGIDCPESGQPWSDQARQLTGDLCYGQDVIVTLVDTDLYGRMVGLVSISSVHPGEAAFDVNAALVEAGMAWVYPQYCKIPECARWRELETKAKAARKGLWERDNPTPPWEWRRGRRMKDAGKAP
ncbi:MAG: thermonuclease family protein [Planctomycetota bacterium]|jgi:endonuclease YncB( thermonuclease family)|nr:thermonuclease family protein [Planctomycetota bacterium]